MALRKAEQLAMKSFSKYHIHFRRTTSSRSFLGFSGPFGFGRRREVECHSIDHSSARQTQHTAFMHHQDESWTHVHDIALFFLGLAYSSDAHLSDEEVDTISAALGRWKPDASDHDIHEIVMEAASVFFESDAEKEVVLSVRTLGEALNLKQRRQVLEDVMRVAEADGILLNAEQNLLSVLAGAWDIKATKDRLIEESTVQLENDPEWSVMHDIALMYIIMGHSTDGQLADT
jgi:hypothetical protein